MMNCSCAPSDGVSNNVPNRLTTAEKLSDDNSSEGIGNTGRAVAATRAATYSNAARNSSRLRTGSDAQRRKLSNAATFPRSSLSEFFAMFWYASATARM